MAAKIDLEIKKGRTFRQAFRVLDAARLPYNLTSATITAECRVKTDASLLFAFTCTKTNAVDGQFEISVPAATTATLTARKDCAYDVKVVFSGGDTPDWIAGNVTILESVTP